MLVRIQIKAFFFVPQSLHETNGSLMKHLVRSWQNQSHLQVYFLFARFSSCSNPASSINITSHNSFEYIFCFLSSLCVIHLYEFYTSKTANLFRFSFFLIQFFFLSLTSVHLFWGISYVLCLLFLRSSTERNNPDAPRYNFNAMLKKESWLDVLPFFSSNIFHAIQINQYVHLRYVNCNMRDWSVWNGRVFCDFVEV